MATLIPQCSECKHNDITKKWISCPAYEIVPEEIRMNKVIHDHVIPGQTGNTIFEPDQKRQPKEQK